MILRITATQLKILAAIAAGCGGADRQSSDTTTSKLSQTSEDEAPHARDGAGHPHGHRHAGHEGHRPTGDEPHGHGAVRGHRFGDASEWSKRFDDPERDAWQRPTDVIAAMKLGSGMAVADIGAGTGYFLPHLSAAVGAKGQVLALDIEADMVRFMKERAARDGLDNVGARVVDPTDPGLEAASMDRILIVNTWHHIADREAYAAKLAPALRPGGAVVIVDCTRESPRGPPPGERLSAETVISELEASGFVAATVDESLPHQYIVVGHRR